MSEAEAARWAEACRWFAIADEDLRVADASLALDPPALGAAAYHCQQAAEKLMKGLLTAGGHAFRKTHDLDELAEAAARLFPALRSQLDACRPYARWGTALRYPEPEDQELAGPNAQDVASALVHIGALASGIQPLARGRG